MFTFQNSDLAGFTYTRLSFRSSVSRHGPAVPPADDHHRPHPHLHRGLRDHHILPRPPSLPRLQAAGPRVRGHPTPRPAPVRHLPTRRPQVIAGRQQGALRRSVEWNVERYRYRRQGTV